MKKLFLLPVLVCLQLVSVFAQRIDNFSLINAVDGSPFTLLDQSQQSAIVLVFTSLNCPFSRLYEDRLIALHQRFENQGISFALINPLSGIDAEENETKIKERVAAKGMPFPFLMDDQQTVSKLFEITKLPEVVVIVFGPTGTSIAYRGAIDNNPQIASNATLKYLENALSAIANKRNPSPASSRPVGCNIRFN